MKKLPLFLCSLLLLSAATCHKHPDIVYRRLNNANHDIFAGFAFINATYLYPDTSFDQLMDYQLIKSHSFDLLRSGESLEESVIRTTPKDTVSIFYFHADTVNKYSWEIIQRDYKILRRYDLSTQDIITLKNKKNGIPEIPYPPDERMKDMKMYPPYN